VDTTILPSRARAARVAVSVLFVANGAISASILPRLPAIKDSLGLSNAELGAAVAAMPVGGLLAGGFVGLLIARFGSGRVATIAGLGAAATLAVLGLAGSWLAFAGTFLLLGMFDATMDASMNAHGIGVERQYGRSIFQGFHGMWSAGSMAAGAAGAVAAAAGVPVPVDLAIAALVAAAGVAIASGRLLPRAVADAHRAGESDEASELVHVRNAPRLLRILLPIAMLGILCTVLQGAAATWGAIFLTDVLAQPAGVAAAGFVVYMAAMTLSRLVNDRWIDRLGRVTVVRIGAVIGGAGLLAVMASAPLASPGLAFVGLALVGVGSSPMFPVMAATAGSVPGIPAGHGVALVSWFVRFGLILAPATVGWAADAVGLAAAFVIPLMAVVAIGVAAPAMIRAGRPASPSRPPSSSGAAPA
jgi:MFS family permease